MYINLLFFILSFKISEKKDKPGESDYTPRNKNMDNKKSIQLRSYTEYEKKGYVTSKKNKNDSVLFLQLLQVLQFPFLPNNSAFPEIF